MMGTEIAVEAVSKALLQDESWWHAKSFDEVARVAVQALLDLWPDHFVTFTADGWIVEHSLSCRLNGGMATCAYYRAIVRISDDVSDCLGRWRIAEIDSEGLPSLTRAEQEGK